MPKVNRILKHLPGPDPRRKHPLVQFLKQAVQRASNVKHLELSLTGMHDVPDFVQTATYMLMGTPVQISNVVLSASIKKGFFISQALERGTEHPIQEPVRMMIEYRGEGERFSQITDTRDLRADFATATQNVLVCAVENTYKARRVHIFDLFSTCGVTTVSDFTSLDILNVRLMQPLELSNFYNPALAPEAVDAEYKLILQRMLEIAEQSGFKLYAHIGVTKANIFFGPPGAVLNAHTV